MKIRPLTGSLSRPFAPAAAALSFALATTACHDSSGGGSTQDLEVMRLEVSTATPNLAHELGVAVELMAAHSTSDVGLLFLIAAAAEVDAGVPETTLEVVDAEGIAEVLAGNHAYSLRLDIPEDTLAPGDYYLIALVDPIGAVPETDEKDNSITADEIEEKGVRITLSGQAQAIADLAVESIELDDVLIDVDVTPDVHAPVGGIGEVANGELGLTATVRATGPDTLTNVVLAVLMDVPGIGLFTLQVWDTNLLAYVPTITIPTLNASEPTAVHMDIVVPSGARNQLATLLGGQPAVLTSCRVFVQIDPLDAHPEFEAGIVFRDDEDQSDNIEITPGLLRISRGPEARGGPASELAWDVPFAKEFSNGNVGVGLRFGANANVGANGIHAEAQASVPMTLVGSTIDLLHLGAVGLFNPLHKADNGMVVTLKALNVKLYERRTKEDEALAPTPLSFAKETAFSSTFTVGPVPMFVRIGARGTVGLDVGASIGSDFELSAEPFLDFSVFGEGGPGGSFAGWTLGGGLGANLHLIGERFHAGITAGTSYDSGTSIMTGSITEEVTNDLTGPSGRVFLFVTAQGKILWKTISERWEYVLAQWQPFTKKDTLFNKTQTLSVTIQ